MTSPPVSAESPLVVGVQRMRSAGVWRTTWRRLAQDRAAMFGLAVLAFLVLVAVFADFLAPYPPDRQDLAQVRRPPSWEHPFGTDELGRDILSRMIYGARVSMTVGIVSQIIILAIGVPIGAAAGYFGGRVDQVVMRAVDVLYSFPDLLLIIIVTTSLRAAVRTGEGGLIGSLAQLDALLGGLLGIFISFGFTSWLTVARLVRGQVLSLKQREFVLAAQAMGAGPFHIIRVHLLPNTVAPVIVAATFSVPAAIMAEAALSFIGLGVQPPTPSWGHMLFQGYQALRATPHMVLFPALALSITVMACNFVGDGLRDALDPWMKRPS